MWRRKEKRDLTLCISSSAKPSLSLFFFLFFEKELSLFCQVSLDFVFVMILSCIRFFHYLFWMVSSIFFQVELVAGFEQIFRLGYKMSSRVKVYVCHVFFILILLWIPGILLLCIAWILKLSTRFFRQSFGLKFWHVRKCSWQFFFLPKASIFYYS